MIKGGQTMSKEKQIEEMAKLACTVFYGSCFHCPFNFYPPCPPKASAERLYNADYRKQIKVHWIRKTDAVNFTHYICSECGHKEDINGKKYCSECGAKMDGEPLDKTEFSE